MISGYLLNLFETFYDIFYHRKIFCFWVVIYFHKIKEQYILFQSKNTEIFFSFFEKKVYFYFSNSWHIKNNYLFIYDNHVLVVETFFYAAENVVCLLLPKVTKNVTQIN